MVLPRMGFVNIDADRSAASAGAPCEIGASVFIVRHYEYAPFQSALGANRGSQSFDKSNVRLCTLMADHLIVGWKRVLNAKGEEVPYDSEVCKNLLLKDAGIRDAVMEFSKDFANFVSDGVEDMGNVSTK